MKNKQCFFEKEFFRSVGQELQIFQSRNRMRFELLWQNDPFNLGDLTVAGVNIFYYFPPKKIITSPQKKENVWRIFFNSYICTSLLRFEKAEQFFISEALM